jgi:2-hydroxy-3-oxopropionate reductase
MKERIGFIGLGIMGKPMVANLMQAGYQLVIHDIQSKRLVEAGKAGAKIVESPRAVTQASEVIITMLPDSPDVESVVMESEGILEGVRSGQIYIDMSTISPAVSIRLAEELAKKSVDSLDAPVSGGEVGAVNATLSIMVGGEANVLERVRPILETVGKTITLCGSHGAGQIVKACNQIQVAMNIVGMAEAFTLAAKAGVDPTIVLKVLSGGYAQCRVMDVRGPKVVEGDFAPGFKALFHHKDLNIALQTANEVSSPLPATALVQQLFNALIAAGDGDLDHTALINVLGKMADV